jgi:hypothetical protein
MDLVFIAISAAACALFAVNAFLDNREFCRGTIPSSPAAAPVQEKHDPRFGG